VTERFHRIQNLYKINQYIKVPQVRVIKSTGENLGVLTTQEALREAQQEGLDLVLISEGANPPIAKILDYNKFLYEERKKTSAIKAKSKKSELKEFVFGPTIGEADINTRIERSKGFILDGNRVKITVKLKGRENEHPSIGFEKVTKFTQGLADTAKVDAEPRLNGNLITVIYSKK